MSNVRSMLRRLVGSAAETEPVKPGGVSPPEPAPKHTDLNDEIAFVRGDEGDFLTLRNDTGVSQTIRETGGWAQRDIGLLKGLLRPGMCVADIGANLGYHSVVFSLCVGKKGAVASFEPQGLLYNLLHGNLALNGCTNVTVHRCALGETTQSVRMWPTDYESADNFGALSIAKHLGAFHLDHDGETVPLVKADELLLPFASRLARLDLIKLDIQAYELFCLRGASETIREFRPTLFLEISPHWMKRMGYDFVEIYDLLASHDYSVFDPDESLLEPARPRHWDGGTSAGWDILAVPKEKGPPTLLGHSPPPSP